MLQINLLRYLCASIKLFVINEIREYSKSFFNQYLVIIVVLILNILGYLPIKEFHLAASVAHPAAMRRTSTIAMGGTCFMTSAILPWDMVLYSRLWPFFTRSSKVSNGTER